jgi:hypothetical protein
MLNEISCPKTNNKAKQDYCYCSIGFGGSYADMLRTLVGSARQAGVKEDFHVWSDKEINGAITHFEDVSIDRDQCNNFDIKRKVLSLERLLSLDYTYFIFLDADTYFVRQPQGIIDLLQGDPMHVFLQTDLHQYQNGNLRYADWSGIPIPVYIDAMRRMGVKHKKIYNINGGFVLVRKDAIPELLKHVRAFWDYISNIGYSHLTIDEPMLAYAMHMLCRDTEVHLWRNHCDVYGTYISNQPLPSLPDGKPWLREEYFTGTLKMVNPAIVHCYGHKDQLVMASRSFVEKDHVKECNAPH